ncbi:hypothetical protein KIL84_008859 [Mauremys mutica]|uniref:Uncharacterized protein n=1 Tax=Mauremys mutica TaxID=74926 RepID=A0A9D4AY54_9SAUR|nr:hypothetical protein KIL84_008859 [Mauremys mutica]
MSLTSCGGPLCTPLAACFPSHGHRKGSETCGRRHYEVSGRKRHWATQELVTREEPKWHSLEGKAEHVSVTPKHPLSCVARRFAQLCVGRGRGRSVCMGRRAGS